MSASSTLMEKLTRKSATIGIVGLGYVGLPLALRYSYVGYQVLGIDIDVSKVEKLKSGKSYIEHIQSSRVLSAISSGFDATSDFTRAIECDALILCVPTPFKQVQRAGYKFRH